MATATTKAQCSVCKKETSTFNCDGCSQKFCWNDLNKHRQVLSQQLDYIECEHNQFRQKFFDQKQDPNTHSSIEEINKWEEESIQLIKQRASECREKLINYLNKSVNKLEDRLNDLAHRIQTVRDENEFNEIDLQDLKEKLMKIAERLNKSSNISMKQVSTSFIPNITLVTLIDGNNNNIVYNFHLDTKWKQNGITIVGENDRKNQLTQISRPRGIAIDNDQTFYITDWGNHCIVEWKLNATNRRIVAGGSGSGNKTNQLNHPIDTIVVKECNCLIISDRDNKRIVRWALQNNNVNGEVIIANIECRGLAMDKDGSLYVVDSRKNEVRRWKRGEKNGIIVAGGNGEGEKLNQLNFPSFIFVDNDYSLYVSDSKNHRIIKWTKDAKEGIVVAGGNGRGKDLKQLAEPQGVIVDELGQIYVADWCNHRVMRWREGEKEGSIVVGGYGEGKAPTQFYNPQGLSFDQQGSLYVSDFNNNRIQKFEIDFS